MQHLVIVRAEAPDRYVAQALGFPDLRGEGGTEAEAVQQVKHSLTAWLASAKLVRVEVPVNGTSNPWLSAFGRSANDPEFAAYQEELERTQAPPSTEQWVAAWRAWAEGHPPCPVLANDSRESIYEGRGE